MTQKMSNIEGSRKSGGKSNKNVHPFMTCYNKQTGFSPFDV